MSDVPVSTMAWQPFPQKATVPSSSMLEEEEREKDQEGLGLSPAPAQPFPPCPAPLTCPAGSASTLAG